MSLIKLFYGIEFLIIYQKICQIVYTLIILHRNKAKCVLLLQALLDQYMVPLNSENLLDF